MVQLFKVSDLCDFDRRIHREGFSSIAGVDEAGRGPWAGPVVAAAVVMPQDAVIEGVNDSKKLTPQRREKIYPQIISSCTDYAVGVVSHETIDTINILNATKHAVQHAVRGLIVSVDLSIVDGNMYLDGFLTSYRSYVGGDSLSFSIACASIIAKVTRDRMMIKFDRQYPGWGFAAHKGYGTALHREAISILGISPIHRVSFQPMKGLVCAN
ncbi:MAG: ribonuclease HII [bacterium]